MALTTQQRKYLRGLCHPLQPVVTVAGKGLTATVIAELEAALTKHELIKVKLRAERALRAAWTEEISKLCKTEAVQTIGQVACFYRRNPKKPAIAFPAAS